MVATLDAPSRSLILPGSHAPFRKLDGSAPAPAISLGKEQRWNKQILSVGVKHLDSGEWNVTQKVLAQLVANFELCRRNGNEVPVIMSQRGDQHDDRASHKIGEVERLYIDGDDLYADMVTVSLSDPEVYQLDVKRHKVSIGTNHNWKDGTGCVYPGECLAHVAIVNHPIETNQKPFVRRMAGKGKGAKRMAKEKELADDGEGDANSADNWTLQEVKDLLAKFNIAIPDSAKTKDAIIAVADALSGGGGETSEETPASDMPADMAAKVATDPSKFPPNQLASALRTIGKQMAADKKRIADMELANKAAAKANFETALGKHVSRGAISEAERTEMVKSHAASGYQLASLSYLDRVPDNAAVDVGGRQSKQLSTSKAPAINHGSHDDKSDDEEKLEATRKFWGTSTATAKK